MSVSEKLQYGFGTKVDLRFEDTVERTVAALQEEGFGLLTTIDVQVTLEAKLGVDMPKYLILGACNPQLAHQALELEPEIGLLLPCNVIVFDDDGHTGVTIIDPEAAMNLAGNPAIEPIARDAKQRLIRVLDRLENDQM